VELVGPGRAAQPADQARAWAGDGGEGAKFWLAVLTEIIALMGCQAPRGRR
jgi:hypothetical protein